MALIGNERLYVTAVSANGMLSPTTEPTTTQAIAALASGATAGRANTNITTVGNGTLTGAAIVGGVITRSGPTGAFTDTTATAAQIYSASGSVSGISFLTIIRNTTAFAETLSAGSGVTLTGNTIVNPNSAATYLTTITSSSASTMYFVEEAPLYINTPEVVTALTTVGAGTITGAGIAGGVTSRTGSTGAFTDTTDTAANIIAAQPNARIGQSWEYTYRNNTLGAATITGGSGVTVSGITVVPVGVVAKFLVTYTAAATITMVGLGCSMITKLPAAQFNTGTTTTTFTAGQLTGADYVVYTNTGATPGSIATRTATQMIADIPNAYIGQTWVLTIVNGQGTGTLTVTAGTDVTLTGTATVAVNTWRSFICTITSVSAHTITIQNYADGTFS